MSDNIQTSNVDLLLDLGSSTTTENNMATKLNGTSHTDMNDSTNKEFDDLLDFDSKPDAELEESSTSADQFQVHNDQHMDCSPENNHVNENGKEIIEVEEEPKVMVNGNSVKDWKTNNSRIEDDHKNDVIEDGPSVDSRIASWNTKGNETAKTDLNRNDVKPSPNFSSLLNNWRKSSPNTENEQNETKPKFLENAKIIRKQETPKAFSNVDNSMTSQANPTCFSCSKRVYPVELKQIDGLTFHKQCFRCTVCKCALTNNFSKLDKSFYCKPHYREIFTRKGKYEVESIPQPANDARAESDERETARQQIEFVQQQKREKADEEEKNGKFEAVSSSTASVEEEASRTPKNERIADELPKSGSVSSLLSAWKSRSSDQSPSTPVRPNFTRQEKKKSTASSVIENNKQKFEADTPAKELKESQEEVDGSTYVRSSVSNTEKDELKSIPLPSARSLRSLFEKGGETKPVERKASLPRRFSTDKKDTQPAVVTSSFNDEPQPESNGTPSSLTAEFGIDGTPSRLTPDEEQPVKGSIKSLLAKFNR